MILLLHPDPAPGAGHAATISVSYEVNLKDRTGRVWHCDYMKAPLLPWRTCVEIK